MLCVLQAMDAAGKDGTIKHVMSGVNPQGVQVTSFKAPGPEELAHDFLWRANRALPERGHIGIFNRSHYEEVLVVRVHPEVLERQHLPDEVLGKRLWDQRLEAIAAFERYLTRQGMVVLKFFLNVSRHEQKRRFLERLEEKDKHWKFSTGDLAERAFWNDYQHAYEEAIAATATPHAPWFVVPADNKWFTRLIVVAAMIEALEALDLTLPALSPEQEAALEAARKKLESEPDTRTPAASPRRVMVRMLVDRDARQVLGGAGLAGPVRGQCRQCRRIETGPAAFDTLHLRERHRLGRVQAADRHADRAGTADVAEPKRRAAAGAEVALRGRGTAERAGRAARPGKVLRCHIGPGTERPADRLLAHPAMADAGALRHREQRVAHRAALTAAGQHRLALLAHRFTLIAVT